MVNVEVEPGVSGAGTNIATVSGGGSAGAASDVDQVPFGAAASSFGIVPGSYLADFFDAAYPFGSPVRQAGDHPFELRTGFDLDSRSAVGEDGTRFIASHGAIKTAEVTLPPGMIGNPEATPKCDAIDFAEQGASGDSTACPADTQVGYVNVPITAGEVHYGHGSIFNNANDLLAYVPIYNLVPPKGVPADFGFNAAGFVQAHIYSNLDPGPELRDQVAVAKHLQPARCAWRRSDILGRARGPRPRQVPLLPRRAGKWGRLGAPFEARPDPAVLHGPTDCGVENGGH